jgi:hypothetical protein
MGDYVVVVVAVTALYVTAFTSIVPVSSAYVYRTYQGYFLDDFDNLTMTLSLAN